MNLDFSEDDRMVREQTSRFFSDKCPISTVRSVMEGQEPYAVEAWRGLAEMGLIGAHVPETYQGAGAGYLVPCVVAEEIGAALAPIPFASTFLVSEAVLQFGNERQKAELLPKLSSGELIGCFAAVESANEMTAESIEATLSGSRVNGSKLVVPFGAIADIALVLLKEAEGCSLALVNLSDESVSRLARDTVDPTRASAALNFANAAGERLGDQPGEGWHQMEALYNCAAVLLAFEQVGGARTALEMAVVYAKERYAFGRPVGSFQALKHMMADMYAALKLAESNGYYAAWALNSRSEDFALAAATARVSATQAYQLCSRDNIQIHGGMGFTWEFDCHLHYRRSNYLALELGGLSSWEERLVQCLTRNTTA